MTKFVVEWCENEEALTSTHESERGAKNKAREKSKEFGTAFVTQGRKTWAFDDGRQTSFQEPDTATDKKPSELQPPEVKEAEAEVVVSVEREASASDAPVSEALQSLPFDTICALSREGTNRHKIFNMMVKCFADGKPASRKAMMNALYPKDVDAKGPYSMVMRGVANVAETAGLRLVSRRVKDEIGIRDVEVWLEAE